MCSIICKLEPDEGSTTLRTSLNAADFLIFFHMKLTTVYSDKCMSTPLLKLRVAISKQVNAAPYLRHKPWQLQWEETVSCQP